MRTQHLGTYTSDPDALFKRLRDATRHNDHEFIRNLLPLMFDPIMNRHRAVYIDRGVSIAYVICKCGVEHDLKSNLPSKMTEDDWRDYVTRTQGTLPCAARPLMRIANIARLLPNPQPMMCVYLGCNKVSRVPALSKESRHPCGIVICGHHGAHKAKLAPTHALSLYIKALKLVKGRGWLKWFCLNASGFNYGGNSEVFYKYASIDKTDYPDVGIRYKARVDVSGTVECGEFCPPLPEVV